jgi:hypothetical protein
MAKQNYFIQRTNGQFEEVEAGSMIAALKKCSWPSKEILTCSAAKMSSSGRAKIDSEKGFLFYPGAINGPYFSAKEIWEFNDLLNRLGYKSVRLTTNMLNPGAGQFLIDADTPSYCDPGCEAYHSILGSNSWR